MDSSSALSGSEREAVKRTALRRMQRVALGLLGLALVLFAVSAIGRAEYPWLGWVYAFSEAAAVGALADWFAVTALFRHPLRLPIPHTAIIPRKKDSIGTSLGEFVERNFLTPENVLGKLGQQNLAAGAAAWLQDPHNSRALAVRLGATIPPVLEAIEDEDVRRLFDELVLAQLERVNVAQLAGNLLEALTHTGHHQGLLDESLKGLERWLNANRPRLVQQFGRASKYTPEFLDVYFVNRLVNGLIGELHAVANDPQHELRVRFDAGLRRFIGELKASREYRERGAALMRDLRDHLQREQYYRRAWDALKARALADLGSERPALVEHVANALASIGAAVRADEALQRKLNGWALAAIGSVLGRHGHQISKLIADVVRSWDAREVTRRVELEIGRDLQYIRINGTLVGGTVGVLLHAFAVLVGG